MPVSTAPPGASAPASVWRRLRRGCFGSLNGQIISLLLGVLLLLQGAGLLATRHSIDRNARAALSAETGTAERVLLRLLSQREQRLAEAAGVLSADFGFRAAIASADRDTLVDALTNQSARVSADVAAFTDANFELKGSTRPDVQAFVAQGRLSALRTKATPAAESDVPPVPDERAPLSLVMLDGHPYQVVAVPVRAPLVIGWIMMGFAVDTALLRELGSLARVDSVLVSHPRGGDWRVAVGTLEGAHHAELVRQLGQHEWQGETHLTLGGSLQRARFVRLSAMGDGSTVGVLILRSFEEAVAPFRQLQWSLLVLNLLGLVLAVAASIGVVRRIAQPIEALQASAGRLGAGDYASPVQLADRSVSREVRQLGQALESMRQQIRDREQEVQRLAYWDPLTALPNLEQLRRELAAMLDAVAHDPEPRVAVLMLDLDRFKHVNDVLGHPFGDRLLAEVSQRLAEVLRACGRPGVLGRSASDEFVFLMPGLSPDAAEALAGAVRDRLEAPFHLEGHTIDMGAGIGLAMGPAQGRAPEELLGRAEIAMYAAKRQGAGLVPYSERLDTASQDSLSLLSELRLAVDADQLRLFLQPKVCARTGRVLGAEALVRWQHPVRGMVPPGLFIPFAEQTGFIRDLTAWMIRAGVQAMRDWRAAGHGLKLSINLSTRDLLDQALPDKLADLLADAEADPSKLCLEITESAIMDDPQRALQTLEALHAMGLHLSIDDFGTGYSSLAYLKRLPVDELKIDRSFVMSMETDADDIKIVRSTIDLAHNLGMTVVAEGVETGGAWTLLDGLACDELQGYFIAKPMPATAFLDWVVAWQVPAGVLAQPPAMGAAREVPVSVASAVDSGAAAAAAH